jgi:parallel beta-helix repeat protein
VTGRASALAFAGAIVLVFAPGPAPAEAPSCTGGDEPGRRLLRVEAPADGRPEGLRAALDRAATDPGRTVLELEGSWYLDRPLELGPRHAGLVVRAGPRGARLSGGPDLSGLRWERTADGTFEARLDPAFLPEGPVDLHLDGRRLEPARHPNAVPGDLRRGWLLTAPGTEGTRAFRARPADLAGLAGEGTLAILLYDAPQWSTNLVRVARLDPARGLVELADNVDWHRLGPGTPYHWLGSRRFLDAPGEWHFDPASRTLALRPPDGRDPSGRRLVAGIIDTLLLVRGGERIRIEGLELAEGSPRGSDRQMPWNHIGGGAIRVEAGREIALCGNRIHGVGVGMALLSVDDVRVEGNRITGTAGNGIYLGLPWGGRPSRRVRISDNELAEIGHRFADSAGILLQGVEEVEVVSNRIERTAQFGIYAMQARANGEDRIRAVRIERNRIHAANLRSADGGGIKLFAAAQDEPVAALVRANRISGTTHLMVGPDGRFFAPEDFDGRRWPQPVAPAIYLDWYARGVTVEGNLLIDNYAGISIVNGSDNRIVGNLVIGTIGAALGVDDKTPRTPGRPRMAGNRFEANIVLSERPGSLAVQIWDLSERPGAAFVGNLYGGPALGPESFVAGPNRLPGGRRAGDFGLWARSAYVAGAEHRGDPGFRDRPALDFRFDPEGLAARLGLPPLDPWLSAGVRENR